MTTKSLLPETIEADAPPATLTAEDAPRPTATLGSLFADAPTAPQGGQTPPPGQAPPPGQGAPQGQNPGGVAPVAGQAPPAGGDPAGGDGQGQPGGAADTGSPAAPVHLGDLLAAMGVAPGSRITVGREASPYADGEHGLFTDLRAAAYGDTEARERTLKFTAQLGDYIAEVRAAPPNTTVTSPEIIPPKWGGEWAVDEIERMRPVVSTFASAGITDPRPFPVPGFDSTVPPELVDEHTEGENPDAGEVKFLQIPVAPKPYSGKAQVSRELLDSSPQLADRMISRALRNSWSRVTERAAATAILAGATTGPNGGATAPLLEAALRAAIGRMPTTRFGTARRLLVPAGPYGALVSADLTDGRPLVPFVGYDPTRSSSVAFSAYGSMAVAGVPLDPAWALAGQALVAAGTDDAMTFESNLLEFRFSEVNGPALIDFAVFGYFGAAVLQPLGVVKIATTATGPAVEDAPGNGNGNGNGGAERRGGK